MTSNEETSLTIAQSNKAAIPRPLQFYDPEFQEAWNAKPADPARLEKARDHARELHRAYLKQLPPLQPRLSKKAYLRFSDPRQPLFDSDLLEFAFGDAVSLQGKRSGRQRLKLSVSAQFRSFNEKLIHTLTYRRVVSLNANIPSDRWFDWGDGRIDNLLADELTEGDASSMRHTLLFASGTLISIQFGAVTWESTRVLSKRSR